jgi:hypothetical protein
MRALASVTDVEKLCWRANPRFETTMNRFGVLLSSCALLFLPAVAPAQNATLEICNNAKITLNVAYAARIQLFITGYRWQTSGWYVVEAGQCKTVYDEDYDDAGPYTPQSGARVAFTAVSGGVWRAYQSSLVKKTGWMQSGTGQICVRISEDAGFTFKEPAGDPAANCTGTLIPVAQDFLPEGPGTFTYTMDWDGVTSSVPVGKPPRSSNVASTASAGHGAITYLCFTTDPKQPTVYLSGIFDYPDAGSQADNFLVYEHAKLEFLIYLNEKYSYSGDEDSAECGWKHAATADASATVAAKKREVAAQAIAAKKKVVETGWKYTGPQVAENSGNSEATKADVEASNEKGRAAMLQWVREDLTAYIEASKTGFEAFKSGEPQLSQGYRMWTSSVKPALATGCWVIQGDSTTTFSCAIPVNKSAERAYYTQLTDDITASLPPDWKRVDGSVFGGSLPSTGYRSSSGAHGEVWLKETADQNYELDYQLVSAPTGARSPKPDDDDPIGGGGFITPAAPPAPPAPPRR